MFLAGFHYAVPLYKWKHVIGSNVRTKRQFLMRERSVVIVFVMRFQMTVVLFPSKTGALL